MNPNAILRPTAGFMLAHPARFIALGFGTGLSPFAPGTVGTLLGFPVYWVASDLLAPYGPLAMLALIAAMFLLGVWACARTGRDLGIADHSGMNWDEIVAFLADPGVHACRGVTGGCSLSWPSASSMWSSRRRFAPEIDQR